MPRTSERERLSRLLIVEDDPSQLRTLTNIMQKEGFEVTGASTGGEALEHLEREDFGVAIVDLRLPDLSGTQLLEKINALSPSIRIIINTGYSSFDSAKQALNLGAFAYIEKAGNPEELVRRVHDASRWHLERYATNLEDAVAVRTSELRKSNDALRSEIAERQRAEERLRKLSVAVEQSPSMVLITDRQGRIEYVNPKFTEVTGYSSDEIVGKNPRILKSGEMTRENYTELWDTVIAGGEWRGEFHNKKKNGELYWESASISGVRNAEGMITHFLAVKEDITERKRVEETLRLTQFAVEHSSDAVYRVRADGRISYANKAACRLLEYSHDQLLAMSVADIDPDFPVDAWPAHWKEMKRAGSMTFEAHHRAGDGRVFPVEIATNHVEYLEQECIWAFVRDLTERKRGDEESLQLREQLHHSQKMDAIGQLAGGMTHSFNNLLQVIRGSLDLLRATVEGGDPAAREPLTQANEACSQAAELARSLLVFAGRAPVAKRSIDLRDVVGRAVNLLDRVLPGAVRLVVEGASGPPIWIDGDPAQLQQVLINLAINARDAMPEGGVLTIRVEMIEEGDLQDFRDPEAGRGPIARLIVTDTGTGMPGEVQSRVFEPFFTTKEPGQGTGLGLSIAHGILQDHGGHISVRSEIGVGSTFVLVIPCARQEAPATSLSPLPAPRRGNGERVLLAMKDAHVRGVMAASLESFGYQVLIAADSLAILGGDLGEEIGVLVLDADLPEDIGPECLAKIRSRAPRVPVIIVAGDQKRELQDCLDERTHLLRKPFSMQDLAGSVGRCLEFQTQLEALT